LSSAGALRNDGRSDRADDLSHQLYDTAASLGGTFSAEHGVGRFKKHLLEKYGDAGRICTHIGRSTLLETRHYDAGRLSIRAK
jgi:FAD/FMN-containing dehydrogenase